MLSEQEVLDICNKVREAGGANPLEGLMPARPNVPDSCLIAKALNFECRVGYLTGEEEYDEAGQLLYEDINTECEGENLRLYMYVEDLDTRDKIEKIFNLGLIETMNGVAVSIPPDLAEVAHAFDHGGYDLDGEYHEWIDELAI